MISMATGVNHVASQDRDAIMVLQRPITPSLIIQHACRVAGYIGTSSVCDSKHCYAIVYHK